MIKNFSMYGIHQIVEELYLIPILFQIEAHGNSSSETLLWLLPVP